MSRLLKKYIFFKYILNMQQKQWDVFPLYNLLSVSICLTAIKGQPWPYTRINNNHVKPTAVHTNRL